MFSLYKNLAEQYKVSIEGAEYVYEWKSVDCYHVPIKMKIRSFTNLNILWRGGIDFFLIRIKNIIYLKCAHAYSSGIAYGNTYNFKVKLFFFKKEVILSDN